MRKILFRGQKIAPNWRDDYKQWLYGDLRTIGEDAPCICDKSGTSSRVYSNTVEQYTGIDDINGVKIFEGDILALDCDEPNEGENKVQLYSVTYADEWASFAAVEENKDSNNAFTFYGQKWRIIGNIFDNPELIGAPDWKGVDIDWERSIHEIDLQLYAKYDLSEDEIEFIETHVKAME